MRDNFSDSYRPVFQWSFLLPRFWPAWMLLTLLWMLMFLSPRQRWALAGWLGNKIYQHYAKRRHLVEVNLSLAFSTISERSRQEMTRAFFHYAAQAMLDYPLLFWSSPSKLAGRVRISGQQHIDEAIARGKSVILLTGHMLGLEYGALALTRQYASVGLVKPARNALFEWLISRGRTRYRGILFARDTGLRKIIKAIRSGRVFYYLPDEDLGERKQTLFVPFFDTEAATLISLGRMSQLCNAEVLPAMTRFDPVSGIYTLEIDGPMEHFPRQDENADALRMNQELEKLILRAPEQYMWSFRLYQTRPQGEASPYE